MDKCSGSGYQGYTLLSDMNILSRSCWSVRQQAQSFKSTWSCNTHDGYDRQWASDSWRYKNRKKNIFKDKTYLRMVRLSFDSSVVPARMDDVWRDDSYNQCVTGTIRISSLRYWLREMVQLWVSLECHDVSSQIQETTITSGMYVYIHLTWCLCQL